MIKIRETRWLKIDDKRYKRYFFIANNRQSFVPSIIYHDELTAIQKGGFGVAKNALKAKRHNAMKTMKKAMEDNSMIMEL